ncbi:regulatory protein RecX [Oscillospiraceae bacterium LTW-04]|nr:regulatory protein RecX [Oscillospiraceae bacterium MB24-C1]
MIITDVRQTKRGRISVYADGNFLFAIEQECWRLSGFDVGDAVDEDALNALLRQSREQEAKRRALNMLSARSYTAQTLTRRLAEKTDAQAARAAVSRMEELGLVDDEDYALRCARDLFNLRGFAPRRIRYELQKRGIASELCALAIEELDCDDLTERATELLRARFGVLKSDTDLRRASSLLERCGYTYSDIQSALRTVSEQDFED